MHNHADSPFVYQGNIEPAHYHNQKVPSFQGNPLIEALPPLLEKEDVYQRIRVHPVYEKEHCTYSLEERLLLLGHGRRFFEPMLHHFDLARRFGSILRDGYVGRNPLNLGFFRETREKLDRAFQNLLSQDLPLGLNLGFDLTGISGIGKTRAIERVSSLYPQIIQHSMYQGQRFTWTQLVWFKLDCPPDGSIASLCTNLFRQLDMVLGTNYYQNYGIRNKPATPAMVGYMKVAAVNHSLGALIIDEIQNLKKVKDPRILDFFVELDNEMGVPIVLVGTPEAAEVWSTDFRRARRAAGQGEMRWGRMQNDTEWRYFLKSLWEYQYIQKPCVLTDELMQTMYYESQGITDIAIKLYFLAQRYAIITGEECIKRETISNVAKMCLPSLQTFLDYIRNNNTAKIASYKNPPLQDIEDIYRQAEEAVMRDGRNDAGSTSEGSLTRQHVNQSEISQGATAENTATHDSRDTTAQLPAKQQRSKEAFAHIVMQGLAKQQLAAYESLQQAHFICNAVEYLVEENI